MLRKTKTKQLGQNNAPANKPQYQQKPQPKQEKPAQPINTDMLEQLKMKFGKQVLINWLAVQTG